MGRKRSANSAQRYGDVPVLGVAARCDAVISSSSNASSPRPSRSQAPRRGRRRSCPGARLRTRGPYHCPLKRSPDGKASRMRFHIRWNASGSQSGMAKLEFDQAEADRNGNSSNRAGRARHRGQPAADAPEAAAAPRARSRPLRHASRDAASRSYRGRRRSRGRRRGARRAVAEAIERGKQGAPRRSLTQLLVIGRPSCGLIFRHAPVSGVSRLWRACFL